MNPDAFATFWAAYPRKVAKVAAQKAFAKLAPDAMLLDKMLQALAWQSQQPAWIDAAYIPYPTTWLNGRRFEDEPFHAPRRISWAQDPWDWFLECGRLHNLSCGNRTAHTLVMARETSVEAD